MTEFAAYLVHVNGKGLEDFMETFRAREGFITLTELTSNLGGYIVIALFYLQEKEIDSRLDDLQTRGKIRAYKLIYMLD